MSKAFTASVLQDFPDCTGVAANQAADDPIQAIVTNIKKEGDFTLPSFGTFTMRKTKARKALNPRTGEAVKVKAGSPAPSWRWLSSDHLYFQHWPPLHDNDVPLWNASEVSDPVAQTQVRTPIYLSDFVWF